MNLRIHTLLAVLISSLVFPSCTWLDTAPEDLVLADDALETEEDLQALLVSCYDVLAEPDRAAALHRALDEIEAKLSPKDGIEVKAKKWLALVGALWKKVELQPND